MRRLPPIHGGKVHPYIPLLAVNPAKERLGHGTSILRHLIEEAAVTLAFLKNECFDVLFLDVYETNLSAIKLYVKCGFTRVTEQSIPDWQEGGAPYIIMAKRLSLAPQ